MCRMLGRGDSFKTMLGGASQLPQRPPMALRSKVAQRLGDGHPKPIACRIDARKHGGLKEFAALLEACSFVGRGHNLHSAAHEGPDLEAHRTLLVGLTADCAGRCLGALDATAWQEEPSLSADHQDSTNPIANNSVCARPDDVREARGTRPKDWYGTPINGQAPPNGSVLSCAAADATCEQCARCPAAATASKPC